VQDPDSERVDGLLEVLQERLAALLAESGDGWAQGVRLAFPDGTPLVRDDFEATVAELLNGNRWMDAISNAWHEAPAPASQPSSPGPASQVSPASGSVARKPTRADSTRSNRQVEAQLGMLREAKHLPFANGSSGDEQQDLPAAASSVEAPPAERNAKLRTHPGQGLPDPVARSFLEHAPVQGSASQEAPRVTVPPNGDLAARAHGGKVVMTSSLDEEHPAENVIDGSEATYWISTGLYPQEILLELCQPSKVSGVRLSSTSVRGVRVEACSEDAAVSFRTLVQGELDCQAGRLQQQELRCVEEQPQLTRFIKTMILSGWDDFCSVHRIVVF